MRRSFGIYLFVVLGALPLTRSHAEIEKVADPREREMVFMWWPKVAPPDNWVHQRDVSYENHINMFVPKGETFADSPAVMYARALYYEKGDTTKELDRAIRDDHEGFQQRFPDSRIEEVTAVKTGDGTSLRTFSFTPQSKGHWELVAYGREPTFVLMFCISADSKEVLEQHRAAFLAMVASYSSKDEAD